ncbi:MAG: phosphatase PAP2 family protein [Bacteroidales bacterium]
MIETLNQLDTKVTIALNSLHCSACDGFFYLYTQSWVWIPLYLVLVFLIWKQYRVKGIYFILLIILSVGLSDFIASGIFKPWVQRLRPSHEPALSNIIHIVNNYRGGQFGFFSSHAANSFSLATFVSLILYKQYRLLPYLLFIWAVLNAYSRLYLGVHYLGDLLVGAATGTIISLLLFCFSRISFPIKKKSTVL